MSELFLWLFSFWSSFQVWRFQIWLGQCTVSLEKDNKFLIKVDEYKETVKDSKWNHQMALTTHIYEIFFLNNQQLFRKQAHPPYPRNKTGLGKVENESTAEVKNLKCARCTYM